MSEQPPADSSGPHLRVDEPHDGPTDPIQSDIVVLKAPEYSVGYRRPPVHTRFKPGRSGNPKGRSKRGRNVKMQLQKVYTDEIVIQVGAKKQHVSRLKALLLRQWERAIKGSERAAQAAIANAKGLGVFDEDETEEGAHANRLSDEILEQLSDSALDELIMIERARLGKAKS